MNRTLFRRVCFNFCYSGGELMKTVQVPNGVSLLYAAKKNKVGIEGACGGKCKCCTCHVILPEQLISTLPEPTPAEEYNLKLGVYVTPQSRLGCQVKVTEAFKGVDVLLPHLTKLEVRK